MGANNKHLDDKITMLYRREVMHLMIYVFIDTYKMLFPSVTTQEAASAFMKHYKIIEDNYSIDTVVSVYGRVSKDIIDAERFKNKQKEASLR